MKETDKEKRKKGKKKGKEKKKEKKKNKEKKSKTQKTSPSNTGTYNKSMITQITNETLFPPMWSRALRRCQGHYNQPQSAIWSLR